MPVSVTAKRSSPLSSASGPRPTSTLPCPVNFTALATRFSRACRSRPRSPSTDAGTDGAIELVSVSPLRAASVASSPSVCCTSRAGDSASSSSSSPPASILDRSRTSDTTDSSASPEVCTVAASSTCSVPSSSPTAPMMPFNGVRISWLMLARKRDFSCEACCAWSRASASSAARSRELAARDHLHRDVDERRDHPAPALHHDRGGVDAQPADRAIRRPHPEQRVGLRRPVRSATQEGRSSRGRGVPSARMLSRDGVRLPIPSRYARSRPSATVAASLHSMMRPSLSCRVTPTMILQQGGAQQGSGVALAHRRPQLELCHDHGARSASRASVSGSRARGRSSRTHSAPTASPSLPAAAPRRTSAARRPGPPQRGGRRSGHQPTGRARAARTSPARWCPR